jgi:hypothetical protein
VWACAALVSAVVATACGVRDEHAPRRVDPETVPFGLAEPEAGKQLDPTGTVSMSVFLEGEDALVAVERRVRGPVDARTALAALLEGPSRDEARLGLSSALPSPDAVRLLSEQDSTATVELSSDFRDGTVTHQVAALAQIVYTLTGVPRVDQVRFVIDGTPAAVPRQDGSLTRDAVDRSDYREFVVGGTAS